MKFIFFDYFTYECYSDTPHYAKTITKNIVQHYKIFPDKSPISLAILMKITFTKNGVTVYYTQTIENPTQVWQIMN